MLTAAFRTGRFLYRSSQSLVNYCRATRPIRRGDYTLVSQNNSADTTEDVDVELGTASAQDNRDEKQGTDIERITKEAAPDYTDVELPENLKVSVSLQKKTKEVKEEKRVLETLLSYKFSNEWFVPSISLGSGGAIFGYLTFLHPNGVYISLTLVMSVSSLLFDIIQLIGEIDNPGSSYIDNYHHWHQANCICCCHKSSHELIAKKLILETNLIASDRELHEDTYFSLDTRARLANDITKNIAQREASLTSTIAEAKNKESFNRYVFGFFNNKNKPILPNEMIKTILDYAGTTASATKDGEVSHAVVSVGLGASPD